MHGPACSLRGLRAQAALAACCSDMTCQTCTALQHVAFVACMQHCCMGRPVLLQGFHKSVPLDTCWHAADRCPEAAERCPHQEAAERRQRQSQFAECVSPHTGATVCSLRVKSSSGRTCGGSPVDTHARRADAPVLRARAPKHSTPRASYHRKKRWGLVALADVHGYAGTRISADSGWACAQISTLAS